MRKKDSLVARSFKYLANFMIWFFIIPAIIDFFRFLSDGTLITDRWFGAKRVYGKSKEAYMFVWLVYWAIGIATFTVVFWVNIIYIFINRKSIVEQYSETTVTYWNNSDNIATKIDDVLKK